MAVYKDDVYPVYESPLVDMLVGVPGAGKSTFVAERRSKFVHVSSDEYVELIANRVGKSYSDVFQLSYEAAMAFSDKLLRAAFEYNRSVILDNTHLTRKSRARKLAMVPQHYLKQAIVFPTPDPEEFIKRLNSRPGKVIPNDVMERMLKSFEYPTYDEGFNVIIEMKDWRT